MTSSTADWAVRYIENYHLVVVQIPPGHKAPLHHGWNKPGGYVTNAGEAQPRWGEDSDYGIGAVLAPPSGLCSLDVDTVERALPALGELGIDLGTLRKVTRTIQGNRDRYRLMFAAPPRMVLGRKTLVWPARQEGGKPLPLLELRAGDIQDVLPPTLHPGAGKPYVWLIPPNSEFRSSSSPYSNCGGAERATIKSLRVYVLGRRTVSTPTSHPEAMERGRTLSSHSTKRTSSRSCSSSTSTSPAASNGYPRQAHRGLAGVTILDGGVFSHHASDPLVDGHPHDAFDIYRIIEHGSDTRSAVSATAEEPGIGSITSPKAPAVDEPRSGNSTSPGRSCTGEEWPHAMDPCAYYGIAGELVNAIEPHTEADPAAMLVQVLVAFGALTGHSPYVQVEGDRHYPNLFGLLIGATSKGRKGTSWGRVRSIFERISGWPRVVSGLSSGEGLKWQVRDSRTEMVKNKKSGKTTEEVVDEGVTDKRLLVIEAEFAQVLRAVARHGNTLSSTVRTAWDTGNLATLTKSDPVTATDAHIAIIGHITVDELRAELTQTDTANGFVNRFLFVCVKRSKCLPFGGDDFPESAAGNFSQRLERAASTARRVGRVTMTQAARGIWAGVYPRLSEGMPGLFGAATARAEAQALRLAMLYALLDEKAQIETVHLLAALAVWEYAEASALHVFGSSLGDPVADEILRAVRSAGQAGMTRTQIRDLFKRNCSADRLGAALDLLARRQLVRRRTQETGGRPSEVWKSI